jgi:hypothetical protein
MCGTISNDSYRVVFVTHSCFSECIAIATVYDVHVVLRSRGGGGEGGGGGVRKPFVKK